MKVENGATNAVEGKYSCRDGGRSRSFAVALAAVTVRAFERTREGVQ